MLDVRHPFCRKLEPGGDNENRPYSSGSGVDDAELHYTDTHARNNAAELEYLQSQWARRACELGGWASVAKRAHEDWCNESTMTGPLQ
jgi:hypothetical protein